jgi:hypothetical protein
MHQTIVVLVGFVAVLFVLAVFARAFRPTEYKRRGRTVVHPYRRSSDRPPARD